MHVTVVDNGGGVYRNIENFQSLGRCSQHQKMQTAWMSDITHSANFSFARSIFCCFAKLCLRTFFSVAPIFDARITISLDFCFLFFTFYLHGFDILAVSLHCSTFPGFLLKHHLINFLKCLNFKHCYFITLRAVKLTLWLKYLNLARLSRWRWETTWSEKRFLEEKNSTWHMVMKVRVRFPNFCKKCH